MQNNYTLISGYMGNFLRPPGHPNHSYLFIDKAGSMSIEYAAEQKLDKELKQRAQKLLDDSTILLTEEYIFSVYKYFKHCYSPDGVDRNVSNCIIDKTNSLLPEYHLGYLMIKKYFPNEKPRLDLF